MLCIIPIMKIDIPKHIKEIRTKLGLTQSELAKRAGLSRQQIADWETNRGRPLAEDYFKIVALEPRLKTAKRAEQKRAGA